MVKKDLGIGGEVVWLQLGETEMKCREDQLRRCLVGWFREGLELLLDFFLAKKCDDESVVFERRVEDISLWGGLAFALF